jgi:hypothetical protein
MVKIDARNELRMRVKVNDGAVGQLIQLVQEGYIQIEPQRHGAWGK